MCFLWIIAFGFNVILIANFTNADQITWGMGCLLIVLLYLLNAQKNIRAVRQIPKELQAGLIFGFGVSLVCWPVVSQQITLNLLVATLITGTLFSINCATVAYWERQIDQAQLFSAWTTQRNATPTPLAIALSLQLALILALLSIDLLPTFISHCLLSSTACMLSLIHI